MHEDRHETISQPHGIAKTSWTDGSDNLIALSRINSIMHVLRILLLIPVIITNESAQLIISLRNGFHKYSRILHSIPRD